MITDYLPVDPMVIFAYALAALTLVLASGPGQGLVLTQTIESGARASLLTSLALETRLLSRPSRSNKAKPTSIHNWVASGTRDSAPPFVR